MQIKTSSLIYLGISILLLTGCRSTETTLPTQSLLNTPTVQAIINTPSPTPTSLPPTITSSEAALPTAESVSSATPASAVTSTPTQAPTSQPTATLMPTDTQPASACVDEAAFYADVTVPDDTLFEANTAFTKIWQVRNTGTCTWDDGYSLVFAKGDVMNGPLSNKIPVIAPGEIAELSVDLVSPSRGGQQTGYWEFQNSNGSRFGVGSGGHDYIWVQIQVDWPTSGGGQQPTAEPTSAPGGGGGGGCAATENTSYESQILSLINSARQAAGLPSLTINSQLTAAAVEHSRDMACADYVDHIGSDGSTWYDRVAAQGYANYSSARENIYVGDPSFGGTPDGAYTWWMNSQVHRDNILYATVTEIGIGYFYNSDSTYGGYYTVVFARP